MPGAFESKIRYIFHLTTKDAESAAIQEAAISNGIVCEIHSVKPKFSNVTLFGRVKTGLLAPRLRESLDGNAVRVTLTAAEMGNWHLTWSQASLNENTLGRLVIYDPTLLDGWFLHKSKDYLESEFINFSMAVPRDGASLAGEWIGPPICQGCGELISPQRLKALPDTQFCVECQSFVEKENK